MPFLNVAFDPGERLQVDIRFSAGRMQVGELSLGRTAGTVTSRQGTLTIGIGESEIYGGFGAGTLSLTRLDGKSRWDCTMALDGIEAGPLLQSLVGLDSVRGSGAMRFSASGYGDTLGDVLSALEGRGRVDLRNGTLRGVNIQAVAQAMASGRLEDLPAASNGSSGFLSLNTGLVLTSGMATMESFALDTGSLTVEGEGRVQLAARTIDAQAVVRLKDEARGTEAIPEIPLVVRGNLSAPRVYPPTRWLLRRASPASVADPIRLDLRGAQSFTDNPSGPRPLSR